ncbi:hypothetical protein FA15DRAFT_663086 [Coprinopsis marcescibilis]|uniref:ATPase inhibitor, mitochondrial n=1 Tax=Coprinopsis marcescibilis TaxID=230819 RepID=A0A5C3LBL1_COPMA|nr:hypothetical protein FA15DRAFT_663086 [Coprinopsis marcescibilis]
MSSGATSQDGAWKPREQSAEAQYARQKEQEQIAALRAELDSKSSTSSSTTTTKITREDRPYEAGFGGQEDLEDRYATTSGEH